jgi:hypothetical protein
MPVSKKHFEEFAAAVKALRDDAKAYDLNDVLTTDCAEALGRLAASRRLAEAFADLAAKSNPAFDRARFLRACGI